MIHERHQAHHVRRGAVATQCAGPDCLRNVTVGPRGKRFCSDRCRFAAWDRTHPRQKPLAFEPESAPLPLAYRGETYIPSLDGERLGRQLALVAACMASGSWMTLREIEAVTGQPQASVSARLRELRHRGATVERRRRGSVKVGLHEYRVS